MPRTRSTDDAEDRIRASYDTVADDYARTLPDASFEDPLDLAMIDAFADAVRCALLDATTTGTTGPPPARAQVLDVGCGTGRMTAYLAARGLPVRGLDPSAGMVRAARAAHPDLRFSVGSLAAVPVADGEVAGLLSWYSIIHTPPAGLADVAAETRRVLAPG
ncbi:MAG: class I SAM-dependent methyltransferase, partial [Cellulomonadaceae bacterium]